MNARSLMMCFGCAMLALSWTTLAAAEEPVAEGPCVEHALTQAAILEGFENDYNVKAFKPWLPQEVAFEACSTLPGKLPLKVKFVSGENTSKLGLRYQTVVELVLDMEKMKTEKTEVSTSKMRGNIEKVLKAAEKDAFVVEVLSAAPGIVALIDQSGRLEFTVPDWFPEPTLLWETDHVTQFTIPGDLKIEKNAQVVAFRMLATSLVEGKTCDVPKHFTATYDESTRGWTFEFEILENCRGKWRLSMDSSGTVTTEKQ